MTDCDIQKLLQGCGVSLKKFHLPEPPAVDADAEYQGKLLAERQYDRKALAESSAKVEHRTKDSVRHC